MAHVENDVIDELNEALRGELSAVETYAQALQKLEDDPGADDLRSIMEDHRVAAEVLREHVRTLGGTPSADSGAWGVWARTVEGTAKLLGDAAALRALKEGEKHGLEEYREIIDDDSVPLSIKQELRSTYIPAQEEHIRILEDLIDESTEH